MIYTILDGVESEYEVRFSKFFIARGLSLKIPFIYTQNCLKIWIFREILFAQINHKYGSSNYIYKFKSCFPPVH